MCQRFARRRCESVVTQTFPLVISFLDKSCAPAGLEWVEAMDLAALFDVWAPRLLAYMITIARDHHMAEDALQNLFVKLATSRPDIANLQVYLFRAARNEALRMKKRRREEPMEWANVLTAKEGAPPVDIAPILQAMDRLPPEQAEAIVLHVLEGLTFKDMAEVLEIPPDTAASRYRYAIEKVTENLKAWMPKS